jgi:hypothetical protein
LLGTLLQCLLNEDQGLLLLPNPCNHCDPSLMHWSIVLPIRGVWLFHGNNGNVEDNRNHHTTRLTYFTQPAHFTMYV